MSTTNTRHPDTTTVLKVCITESGDQAFSSKFLQKEEPKLIIFILKKLQQTGTSPGYYAVNTTPHSAGTAWHW